MCIIIQCFFLFLNNAYSAITDQRVSFPVVSIQWIRSRKIQYIITNNERYYSSLIKRMSHFRNRISPPYSNPFIATYAFPFF